jgi:ribosomal protein S18 acetylase RimI-like enzyme
MNIRRIREPEAAEVVALWDDMGRAVPDGGPLTGQGRRHLERMLAILAWHREAFCLVAPGTERIDGFVCARIDTGTGLLPSAVGEVEELYVRPDAPPGLSRQLAQAAVTELRARGAHTVRHTVSVDDLADRELFTELGFDADMIRLSLYKE